MDRSSLTSAILLLPRPQIQELIDVILSTLNDRDINDEYDNIVTARLIARFIEANPETEAVPNVVNQFTLSLENRENNHAVSFIVQNACAQSNILLSSIMESIDRFLARFIKAFSRQTDINISHLENNPSSALLKEEAADLKLETHGESVIRCLSFLHDILQTIHSRDGFAIPSFLTVNLFPLLSHSLDKVRVLSLRCIDIVLRLHNEKKCTIGVTFGMSLDERLWSVIRDLVQVSDNDRKLSGLRLWARWETPRLLTKSEEVWSFITEGLMEPSQECQKLSIYILKKTLKNWEDDVSNLYVDLKIGSKSETTAEFQKYCTLFETVMLDRYPNQVIACLPELTRLARRDSQVKTPWIFALLTAALSLNVQDSIRKIIGNWYLHNGECIAQTSKLYHTFLARGFLPWVTQGSLFVGSIQQANEVVRCLHGESLTKVLSASICQSGDAEIKRQKIVSVLGYIATKGDHLFPYASIFLLRGILSGLESLPSLKEDDAELLIRIARRTDMPEIARDLLSVLCLKIFEVEFCESKEIAAKKIEGEFICKKNGVLQEEPSTLESGYSALKMLAPLTGDDALNGSSNLEFIYKSLFLGRDRNPSNNGLRNVCDMILDNLNSTNDQKADLDVIQRLVSELWHEACSEDFPRPVAIKLPEILLHPICVVALSNSEHNPPDFLRAAVLRLLELSSGRIYCLTPVLRSLQRACMSITWAHIAVDLATVIISFAQNPPKVKADLLLEQTCAGLLQRYLLHRDYSYYYGSREGEGYAFLFDLVNRHDPEDVEFARKTLDELIKPWSELQQKFRVVSKWKTTVQLQLMLLLVSKYSRLWTQTDIAGYLSTFTSILAKEAMPKYRFLLEWIVSRIHMCGNDMPRTLLNSLSPENVANPKYTASLLKILSMLSKLPETSEEFCRELMTIMVPLSACPKVVVRHETHWVFPIVWDVAVKMEWTSITGNPSFVALNDYIRKLGKYDTPPRGRNLESLDLVADHNLSNLLTGKYLLLGPSEPTSVSLNDLQKAVHSSNAANYPMPYMDLGECIRARPPVTQDDPGPTPRQELSVAPLQTKGSTWENGILSLATKPGPKPGIILLASLVNNPHNLGGLSRCAEIFGAEKMTMRSLNPLTLREFEAVAVNSHQHLPIEAVRVYDIPNYLVEKKRMGYSVVGVEQTDRSLKIGRPETILPLKIVLVLGSEREGIPAEVLLECDFCVEIPQVGVTRSLNVQTAASIVLCEYRKQHSVRPGI